MHPSVLDRIAQNLADIGAVSLEDYLEGHCPAPRQPSETADGNAVTLLHHACQRAFRTTDPLKFEFVDSGSRSKQCILSITKPDGTRRSYATQPVFAKKAEAKLDVARIAIDMGALDFLAGRGDMASASVQTSELVASTGSESSVEDIEKCCLEWRAGRVTPHWVPFFDPRAPQKQGCALHIQLSPHVARLYLSEHTFGAQSDAKVACAGAAVSEGVLEFIKHGNGQTHPSSPIPPTTSTFVPEIPAMPLTLQAFYDALPRPFPEVFQTTDAYEINPQGWINNMIQSARGGKLVLSFFFVADGPPGLHGCILKLDRPGEYRASLVDARFPKRFDAKAAACFQAMSEGIGDYIRSIASTLDNKITSAMRSFTSNMVYPALTSGLSKIDTDLHPRFEYTKERDAFGATMIIGLSTLPTAELVRHYTVPSDYRSKAEAKTAVVCHAAEQGVVEFIRFRGGTPPDGYVSPFSLSTYNPDTFRKRKQSESLEDASQGLPSKKKRKKGKRRAEDASLGDITHFTPVGHLSAHPSSDQIYGVAGPGDMGLSQNAPADGSCGPSRLGVGGAGISGAVRPVGYGHGLPSFPGILDPRGGRVGNGGHGVLSPLGACEGPPSKTDEALLPASGPSRATPGSSMRRPTEDAELEPGEVVSSAESEFSVSSSRNDDGEVPTNERDTDSDVRKDSTAAESGTDKGKAKVSPANHVRNLIDHCARRGYSTPSFHALPRDGRFLVWIVIGRERYDLPTTYGTPAEGRQRVAKQVLARLSKATSG